MTARKASHSRQRRGSDIVRVEEITASSLLRRYIIIGSWVGQILFVLYGIYLGLSFGAVGGLQFFTDMIVMDYLGGAAKILGVAMGIFVGLVCVWAIFVIVAAACGAAVYWFKYKSFPAPEK